MKQPTPKALGYRMPAEWEPQEAVWLSWPHNELTWPAGMLAEVERSYIEIIRAALNVEVREQAPGQRTAHSQNDQGQRQEIDPAQLVNE